MFNILKLSQIFAQRGIDMYQKERIDLIKDILDKNGFVTVKHLIDELHYSSATINRDLNFMQNQGIVRRSFGGVELVNEQRVPLYFRYSKMRAAKSKIGKRAADFIKDGDTIFIDCSTTAQYIGKYITDRTNLTVITNNLALVSFLSEYSITCICLGGKIIEAPYMAYSAETVENARRYGADKLFFSAGGITTDGKIRGSEYDIHNLLIRTMMENSKEKFLLFDCDKVKDHFDKYIGSFDDIEAVITDYHFVESVKKNFANTDFIIL